MTRYALLLLSTHLLEQNGFAGEGVLLRFDHNFAWRPWWASRALKGICQVTGSCPVEIPGQFT